MLAKLSFAAALLTFAAAPGCGSHQDVGYIDDPWANLPTTGGPAVLDDASTLEDPTDPPSDLDTLDDVAEAEFDDPNPDAEGVPADVAADVSTRTVLPMDEAAPSGTFQNSVFANCADPGVVRDGSLFVVACTGGGYPMFTSSDLVHWSSAGTMFNQKTRPQWANGNFWAPEIHPLGAGFVAYFAAMSPSHDRMCIGAAKAPHATGPWTDIGRPLVCQSGVGLIDPNFVTDGQGNHYLYYKVDANSLTPEQPTIIYGHQLGADGVSFVGKRHRLIQNTRDWEGDVTEAPWVVKHGSYWVMFYSGYRYCDKRYAVGVARSKSPLGPFRKLGDPILKSSNAWVGPGHNATVNVNGHDWIVYAAWKGAHTCSDGGDRNLLLDRIAWKNSWPSVNAGYPSQGRHTAPLASEMVAQVSGDVCSGKPDGGYCSDVGPQFAYICSGGTIVSTLQCTAPATTCVSVAADNTLTCK